MSLTLKQFASKGGRARAAKLSKERRQEIASKAGKASAESRACRIFDKRLGDQLTSKQYKCQSDQNSETK